MTITKQAVYAPRSLPCNCRNGEKTEHRYNREAFTRLIFVCCRCGAEKAVKA
jgi:hypothetical protein